MTFPKAGTIMFPCWFLRWLLVLTSPQVHPNVPGTFTETQTRVTIAHELHQVVESGIFLVFLHQDYPYLSWLFAHQLYNGKQTSCYYMLWLNYNNSPIWNPIQSICQYLSEMTPTKIPHISICFARIVPYLVILIVMLSLFPGSYPFSPSKSQSHGYLMAPDPSDAPGAPWSTHRSNGLQCRVHCL